MKQVCSFLPAVTQMIYDMGLDNNLQGVTFECPDKALAEKEKVVRYALEGRNFSSIEIDEIFSKSKQNGESLYYVDEAILQQVRPDLIFTQDTCEVCQIDTACTAAAVAKLDNEVELVPISPDSFEDVLNCARFISNKMGHPQAHEPYLRKLRSRISNISEEIIKHKMPRRKVSLIEWVDPIYNCGHWIPDQIEMAGGKDELSNPSGDSYRIKWEQIREYDPEVIVIAPCGYRTKRTLEDLPLLIKNEGWQNLKAVQSDAVYLVDFDVFTQPSASTLVEGIEILASIFHSDHFDLSNQSRSKVIKAPLEALQSN